MASDPPKPPTDAEKTRERSASLESETKVEHHDDSPRTAPSLDKFDEATRQRLEASHKLAHPLAGISQERLGVMGEEYARDSGMTSDEDIRAFRLGAMIAGNENRYDTIAELTEREREVLDREETHKWSNPSMLYWVIVICSLCAAVQGMDETVVNGAQSFYKVQFGIGDPNSSRDSWLLGLCNSAPYLCCAVVGCWLTDPMNRAFGRRGTIFIACLISALACFWQAFTNTWYHMFIARFFLGFGIGPKSATTPIFAAECAPPKLRGALVMQWQMWTAFGIMIGYAADLAFYFVPDSGIQLGLNWRLMMGSAMIPAVIVCCMIHMCPESPRWYLSKNKPQKAFDAVCQLRHEKVQAARDLFYMSTLLKVEQEAMSIGKQSRIKEFLTIRRNRNAMIASEIVMFMQQMCGVNVIAYYSSEIFLDAGFSPVSALAASLGFGVVNWLFALPAFYTIDTFGRRNLLLTTFPLMSLFLFFTGFSFWIPQQATAHIACIALGIYLFGVVYSPGEGPVPFTYSAEAYPLYIRPIGMSLATATTWFFNFVLSVTWPSLLGAFKPQGAFGFYAAWNIVGFFAVLFFVPETKEKTLEELDSVFDVSISSQIKFGAAQFVYFFRRYIFRQDVAKPPVPHSEAIAYHEKTFAQEQQRDATARV
ncbi:putative mfs sugar transporter protein [Phialemonium atrogriseum]|uniref:Mfs sugar transporter protein n=1 Tax=Phialemonium atrogriseum TaxID=1093897 RepID=A0AAJ0C9B1_9PEZI|nr:putative mfs sugar transporter protein [Phialemonium atrogriseum]KAK1772553.1 putative mfs sugar transporter protein [Phialemonium atrogriseum]